MLLISVVCLCLFAYGIKNAAGINLFKDFSLSAYFPFSLLLPDYTVYPQAGQVILDENFELLSSHPVEWLGITTPEPDSVTVIYDEAGVNSSRSLVVKNTGDQWWHISHRYLVAVKEGDKFSMEAMLWNAGKGGFAEIQVSAIDPDGRVTSRNWRHVGPSTQGKFEHVHQLVSVGPGIALIRFRLAGKGQGEFKFDDVKFRRLERDQ